MVVCEGRLFFQGKVVRAYWQLLFWIHETRGKASSDEDELKVSDFFLVDLQQFQLAFFDVPNNQSNHKQSAWYIKWIDLYRLIQS